MKEIKSRDFGMKAVKEKNISDRGICNIYYLQDLIPRHINLGIYNSNRF